MREEKIGLLIDEVKANMTVIKRIFDRFFYQTNEKLSRHQFFCLHSLSKCGMLSMSNLANMSGVSNQQLTRIVDGLVEYELVERFVSPENRRVVLVQLSHSGKEFIQTSNQNIKKRTAQVLNVLTDEEIDSFIQHIHELKNIIIKLT